MEITIQRLDDRSLYELFSKAKSRADQILTEQTRAFPEEASLISIQFDVRSGMPWELPAEDYTKAPPGQYLISHIYLQVDFRQPQNHHEQMRHFVFRVQRGAGTAIGDTLSITKSGHSLIAETKLLPDILTEILRDLSPLMTPVQGEDGTLVPTLTNLAAGFDVSYRRIAEELSSALESVSRERAKQLDEFTEERARLHAEMAAERESERAALAAEVEKVRSELELERQAVAEERAKLEVSSHKDARRKQFGQLQEDLEKALAAPVAGPSLQAMRYAVFAVLVIAGIAAGCLAYASIRAGSTTGAHEVINAVRSTILTFAALASFAGAAAWLRYFYLRDMEMQAEMRRFRNDMARASWVMDATMEIRKEHGEDIPPEWIAGVTEGLFSNKQKDTLEEGAQALAALMGLSASASFGPGGTTVEVGRRGAKEIAAAFRKQSE